MGYRDSEFPSPIDLFPASGDPINWNQERLHLRAQAGQGEALFRLDQLDAFYDDLLDEPLLRLEYDRFSPTWTRRA